MANDYRVGSRALLKVVEGDEFEGFIHSFDSNIGKITLQKVTLCGPGTKRKLQGLQHFQGSEIEDLQIFEDVDSSLRQDPTIKSSREQGPKLSRSKSVPIHLQRLRSVDNDILLTRKHASRVHSEEEDAKKTPSSLKSSDYDSSSDVGEGSDIAGFYIIDKLDEVFREAVEFLRQQSVVAVALQGVNLGREGILSWMQFACKNEVLLFDVLSLKEECFQQGLREILESGTILKVMHDCRQPSDILYHQYGVELINVFDTQVAGVMLIRMSNDGDYSRYVEPQYSLLLSHLHLSLKDIHILRYRDTHKKEDQEIWCERPPSANILTAAVKQVKHLLPLRVKLMEHLLKEVNVGTDIYLSYIRDASKEDAKRGPGINHLLPHAFQSLKTHMDFRKHQYIRPTRIQPIVMQKDQQGFSERVHQDDPYIVGATDSIWHLGPNWKSPAYDRRRRSDGPARLPHQVLSDNLAAKSRSLPASPREQEPTTKPTLSKLTHTTSQKLESTPTSLVPPPASEYPVEPTIPVYPKASRTPVYDVDPKTPEFHVDPKTVDPKTPEFPREPRTPVSFVEPKLLVTPAVSYDRGHTEVRPSSKEIKRSPDSNIIFRPAGCLPCGKKNRSFSNFSDSDDFDSAIKVGDYSGCAASEAEQSFSCIPSRESLGRSFPLPSAVSLRESIESAELERSDQDTSADQSGDSIPTNLSPFNRACLPTEASPFNRACMDRGMSDSDSDTSVNTLLSQLRMDPSPIGRGRGVAMFASPSTLPGFSPEPVLRTSPLDNSSSPQDSLPIRMKDTSPFNRQSKLLKILSDSQKSDTSESSDDKLSSSMAASSSLDHSVYGRLFEKRS